MRTVGAIELAAAPAIGYVFSADFSLKVGVIAGGAFLAIALYSLFGFEAVVRWRMRRRSLHQQLLEEAWHEADEQADAAAAEKADRVRHRFVRLAMLQALWVLAVVVTNFNGWAGLALFVLVFALHVSRLNPRVQRVGFKANVHSIVRGLAIVWVAVCVLTVALVSLDEFRLENIALVVVVFAILGILWTVQSLLRNASSAPRTR